MTISTQRLRFLRGNSAAAGAFTGLQGELIFDTTLYTLRLQDGVTPGGYLLARASDVANVAANANYGNTNVAAYLVTYTGNLSAGNILSNNYLYPNGVNILSGIQSNYGNSNVAAYLVTYTGNLSAGNIFSNNYLYANGVSILTGIQSNYGNSNVGSYLTSYTGNLTAGNIVSGNILPAANVTYSLGSSTAQWKDLWLSNNTMYLGGFPLTITANGTLQVNGSPVIGGETYGNANVASFLPTYSGNVNATYYFGNGSQLTGIIASSATTAVTAQYVTDLTSSNVTTALGYTPTNYSNTNVAAYLIDNPQSGTYSNANVADYLPTYTGNIAGNIVKGSNTWVFDENGNIALPVGGYVQVTGGLIAGPIVASPAPIISGFSSISSQSMVASGNVTAANLIGNVIATLGTFGTVNGAIGTASQTGITTIGTLTGLAVSGSTTMTTLQVSGNATIGNLLVTGNSTIIGNITQISGNSGQFFGNAATGFNALYTGIAAGYTPLQQTIVQSSGNYNDYVQINLENVNSGNAATADYIVTADNGTDATYFVDMGIASSNFDGLSPNIVGNSVRANDAYLYTIGNGAGNQGGNLIIGAGTAGKIIKLIAGGGSTNDIVATVAAGAFTVTGNISGTSIIGNGSQLTGVAAVTATTATTATYVTGLTSANVTTALGFVPANSNAASNYGNTNVAAYLPSYGGPINSNTITVTANTTTNGLTVNTSGVFNTTLQARGGLQNTPIGNVNGMASTGSFTTITANGNVTVANLTANGNISSSYFIGNGALLTGIAVSSTYSNTNVASYLTGNIVVGNIAGTQPNVTLVANTFSYIFDNVGNITIPGNINYANGLNILSGISGGSGNYGNANVAEYLPIYSGNINAAFYFGNGSQLTGITVTNAQTAVTAQYVTGLTSSNVTTALGYVPLNSNGTAITATTAQYVTGLTSSNITTALGYTPTNYSNSNVVSLLTNFGSNTLSTTGNVTAEYFIGNGALLTGIAASSTYSNTNVAAYLPIYGGPINANTITTTANTTINALTVNSSVTVGSTLGVTGNVIAANLILTGNINATYFIGNGALLTGIIANTTYGNSNVASYLPVYGGPINANTITGTANTTVNALSINNSVTIGTTLGITGNINGAGITLTGSLRATGPGDFDGGLQSTPIGNVTPSSGLFTTVGTSANLTANALTVNNTVTIGGTLGVTGNITTAANVTVSGNIVATNIVTTGTNGNITGVNIVYGNVIGSGNTTVQALTVNANATIGGTLGVTGATVLTGNLTVNGTLAGYAPNRPAMRVYGNTSTNFTVGTTLTNQVVDYNQGNYYDNTTGIFTAPVAGLYHCYATVRVGNNNGLNQATLVKNDTVSGANIISFWETDTNTGTASHFSMTGYARCVVGDTIRFKVVAGNVQFDSNDSWGITYIG